jgi:hypothetical protein
MKLRGIAILFATLAIGLATFTATVGAQSADTPQELTDEQVQQAGERVGYPKEMDQETIDYVSNACEQIIADGLGDQQPMCAVFLERFGGEQ